VSRDRPQLRYARRAAGLTASEATPESPEAISFGAGDAYPEWLPDFGELAREAASRFRSETLQYAPRLGLGALREWVVAFAAEDGVALSPSDVLIVNGAKHALDLVCKLFLEPGDAVVVTSPTYMSALGIFRGYEADYVEVRQDDEGLDVAALSDELVRREQAGRAMPKLLYDVPEFHNPTGVTLTLARRRALLALADRYDFLIVEDDPYRRIRFEGEAVPPIQSLDPRGRVIGLGTFAKLIAPGFRVGWVAAAPEIVRRMAQLKSDGGSCPLTQRMILQYVAAGRLEPHVRDVTAVYRGHRDVMIAALERELPGAIWRVPAGGYYLWIRLPEAVSGEALARAALQHGVRVLPAAQFYATRGPENYIRLAYSYASPADIIEGIHRLGEALREIA
jgi:2-aminoadipate transaminase